MSDQRLYRIRPTDNPGVYEYDTGQNCDCVWHWAPTQQYRQIPPIHCCANSRSSAPEYYLVRRVPARQISAVSCGAVCLGLVGACLYGTVCLAACLTGAVIKGCQMACENCSDTEEPNRECYHNSDWDVIVYRRKKGAAGVPAEGIPPSPGKQKSIS